jgi:Fe-S oxidoreductase
VLEKQGVYVRTEYTMCCGMPQLETGNLQDVARRAAAVAAALRPCVAVVARERERERRIKDRMDHARTRGV